MRRLFSPELVARWSARLALLGLAGCVEPYVPAVINAPTTFLVVDGFINGNGRSTFLLSRTINVATTTAPPVEPGASVAIVDDGGARYPLRETQPGTYQSDSLVLNAGRQYQLSITTSANAAYESDPVPLKVTPPIDKLGWQISGDQLQIRLNTHDPAGQARYYRWSAVETWEFNAGIHSFLEYYPHPTVGQATIDGRTTPIYTCWRTERPTAIKQGTSAALSQDAITDAIVLSFSDRDERLIIRYSVLVSQAAETAEEFAYRELLRKNTEAVGTVNDPLPTQLTGNVHRVGQASEPVLGFVGAHTVQQQRLFINRADLPFPKDWQFDSPYQQCIVGELRICDLNGKCDLPGIIKLLSQPSIVPVDYSKAGYYATSPECADCRLRGSNVKPSFW